jgi:hypothetical protein
MRVEPKQGYFPTHLFAVIHRENQRSLQGSYSQSCCSTKPHNPVTSTTVGRWIEDQLKEAGIDTSIFLPTLPEGQRRLKTASFGVSIEAILKQGHWSNESTFLSSTVVNRQLNRIWFSQLLWQIRIRNLTSLVLF